MADMPGNAPVPPDRAAVQARLAAERAATQTQIEALSRDFTAIVEANALVAVDDEHDPDGSSTAFERAHVASLLAQARTHLEHLDEALTRLTEGTYGVCEICGTGIPAERLEVRPATTRCVGCAGAR
ncbi:TraR/DksA family transcriptional regulator [Streptomyces sp. NPDC017615]|uniref:TraR/DksA family transcriptional regulator n=1 Tax=unclassified Streptomyces TaxID=2593676 RepID=UPI00136BC8CA|nr:TraR/DksA C4-type zinc finger protein [Streptomyces sp. SID4982]MYS13013.1 TraR/DksA family transcriptional regulator [Streptomyces sp. SID4982]